MLIFYSLIREINERPAEGKAKSEKIESWFVLRECQIWWWRYWLSRPRISLADNDKHTEFREASVIITNVAYQDS